MGTRTCPGGARARYRGPCRRHSSRRWAGGQTSRTLRATAIPIATRISKTSSFFTADLLVDGRCPDASETGRPAPEVNGVWWPPSSSKRVGRANPRPVGSIPATSARGCSPSSPRLDNCRTGRTRPRARCRRRTRARRPFRARRSPETPTAARRPPAPPPTRAATRPTPPSRSTSTSLAAATARRSATVRSSWPAAVAAARSAMWSRCSAIPSRSPPLNP